MKRLCVLLCALCFCGGCASEDTKAQWDEVLKDLRGDNMQMKNDFVGTNGLEKSSINQKPTK